MTTHDALLTAVLANPADDLPRLVLADWLEEHGQPERAEFIRVQCSPSASTSDIARVLGGTGTDWVTAGVGKPNDWSWSGGLMTCYDDPVEVATSAGVVLSYVRGFVAEVRCRLADWCWGKCRRCGGGGGRRVDRPDVCSACHGTGHTPGIGPRLVREHPIELVVLTDREPQSSIITSVNRRTWRVADNSRKLWLWLEDFSGLSGRRSLPPYVFRFLAGRVGENPVYREYDAEGEAERDASFAIIAWAKYQAPHVSTTPVSADVTR